MCSAFADLRVEPGLHFYVLLQVVVEALALERVLRQAFLVRLRELFEAMLSHVRHDLRGNFEK